MEKRTPSVRAATAADLEEIVKIYDHARSFMRACGNMTQWPDSSYPNLASAREDLEKGVIYVAENGGAVVGTFVMMPGPDDTYVCIENGAWRSDAPYGVIHRVASRGGGVLGAALEYAKTRFDHIRMDTHADNAPMRHLLEKSGFSHRGTIYVSDGTPRMAFDLLKEDA
ncbi:MAG: GNAT family N-acetyltransferase [Oscillospiraceae bacterium]|nr:GNAT family N-acetyltransferase [Oscillospiraceae bacterium]